MEENIRVKVQIQAKHILQFQFYHTYISLTGIMMVVLCLIAIFGLSNGPADQNTAVTMIYVIIMIWCIIFTPLNLYLKSLKQAKTVPLFKEPMEFAVSSKGIGIYQHGQSGEAPWEEITKVVVRKSVIIFYMGKVRANLLPIDQVSDRRGEIMAIVRKYAGKKIKGSLR